MGVGNHMSNSTPSLAPRAVGLPTAACNCFVPKQKSDSQSSFPASLFINAPCVINQRKGEVRGEGEGGDEMRSTGWRWSRVALEGGGELREDWAGNLRFTI